MVKGVWGLECLLVQSEHFLTSPLGLLWHLISFFYYAWCPLAWNQFRSFSSETKASCLKVGDKVITYLRGVEGSIRGLTRLQIYFQTVFPLQSLCIPTFRDSGCLSSVLNLELGCFFLALALKAWVWTCLLG